MLLPVRGGSTDPPSGLSTPSSFLPPSSQVRDFKLRVEDLLQFPKTLSVRWGSESSREHMREVKRVVVPPAGPDSSQRHPFPDHHSQRCQSEVGCGHFQGD